MSNECLTHTDNSEIDERANEEQKLSSERDKWRCLKLNIDFMQNYVKKLLYLVWKRN